MNEPRLSVMVLTMGKQPLVEFCILSLLPQMKADDTLVISVNSQDPLAFDFINSIIRKIDATKTIDVISPKKSLSVYEHYRFAIEAAASPKILIAHDDEIYNSSLLDELRTGFSDPEVTMVVGGMLIVEPLDRNIRLSVGNNNETTKTVNGLDWMKGNIGLYPAFCFSSLTVNRDIIDLDLFTAESTAADCLAVTQQAIAGKVFLSDQIFATWLQLSSRNSRWYLVKPGLIAPWKEFLNFYMKLGDSDMIAKGLHSKELSLSTFIRLLFVVAVSNRNIGQIDSCLGKIGEISQAWGNRLSIVRHPVVYWPLSLPLRIARHFTRLLRDYQAGRKHSDINPPQILNITTSLWTSYISKSLAQR